MIYVLTYEEDEIIGNRIFDDYKIALIEFLKHNVSETKTLLEQDDEDDYDITKCKLEIYKLINNEYELEKEYDYNLFEKLIESKDDIEEYLDEINDMVIDGNISDEITELFAQI
jgi:hypothetical protein